MATSGAPSETQPTLEPLDLHIAERRQQTNALLDVLHRKWRAILIGLTVNAGALLICAAMSLVGGPSLTYLAVTVSINTVILIVFFIAGWGEHFDYRAPLVLDRERTHFLPAVSHLYGSEILERINNLNSLSHHIEHRLNELAGRLDKISAALILTAVVAALSAIISVVQALFPSTRP